MSKNDKQKKPRTDVGKATKAVSDYQAEKGSKPESIIPDSKKRKK
ncbi:hypothetical protein EDD80_10156 [Anseongella ginsenosidimutans]|uniref:Uncharacterized protein n=1 Tax=Anseongella ginsenosidimutans TaxID=496056 RepID=A0A4R3KVV7_9SPHI|nr:hypothetical protein EDD80_10156 [Anseongella ginsenosidimutans]